MKKFMMVAMALIVACGTCMADVDKAQMKQIRKDRQEIRKMAQKELKVKISKEAQKEAKKLAKQGWTVTPGSKPLARQLDDCYQKQYEFDENLFPKYIMADAQSIGGNYDAAKTSALSLAITNLAAQIQTEVTALVENTVANKQLDAGDAASISETVMSSKNLISQSLGRTIPIMECYRETQNGNKEVLVRIAYNGEMAKAAAKKAVQAELEKKGANLHEQLDKALGY